MQLQGVKWTTMLYENHIELHSIEADNKIHYINCLLYTSDAADE